MEVTRGTIGDRPWGEVFAGLALDEPGCELVIDDGSYQYRVAFERNAVLAATSPLVADSALRVALTSGIIAQGAVPVITQRLAAEAGRDIIELIGEISGIPPAAALQLRRRVITQAATRTFSLTSGTYQVTRQVTLRIHAHAGIDIRAVVYSGLRTHVTEERLAADLARLGSQFTLRPDAHEDLAQYGFTTYERPLLISLQAGATVPDLEKRHPELGAQGVRAVVYALAACRGCDAVGRPSEPVIAPPAIGRTPTNQPASRQTGPLPMRGGSTAAPPLQARPVTSAPPLQPRAATAPVRPTPPTLTPPVGQPARTATVPPPLGPGARASTVPPPAGMTLRARPATNAPADDGADLTANERYERGLVMMRDNLPAAIVELQRAATMSKNPEHIGAMAFAVFCITEDKQAIANTTRKTLNNAIFKSDHPERAEFWFGRVERMLGRDEEALEHFQACVDLSPRHAEALAEIRLLEARRRKR